MSRRSVFLCLLLLLCLITGCSLGQGLWREQVPRTPERTEAKAPDAEAADQLAARLVQILELDQPEQLLPHLQPQSLNEYGRSQIVDRSRRIHEDLEVQAIHIHDLEDLKAPEARQKVYRYRAAYETSYGLIDKEGSFSLAWRPEAERWELIWNPSLILPGLAKQDRIQIDFTPPKRGEILDCRGRKLAENGMLKRISLIPQTFDLSKIPQVAKIFPISESGIKSKLEQSWVKPNMLVPLLSLGDLSEEQRAALKELHLVVDGEACRVYPYGECISPLLGYVGEASAEDLEADASLEAGDVIGRAGLEQLWDERLRGKAGYEIHIVGAYPQTLLSQAVQNGENIRLSLDIDLQNLLYEQLRELEAAATLLDPQSGAIRALVSTPAYDANLFARGISQQAYNDLLADPRQPLRNRAWDAYTPGSTFKVLTAMAALQTKAYDPKARRFIQGESWQATADWGTYAVHRYNRLDQEFDLLEALVRSDNIYFAQVALEMGVDSFTQGLKKLGVGQDLVQDLPLAPGQLVGDEKNLREQSTLLADSAYGQGQVLISGVHLASAYASLLNGGRLLAPSLEEGETGRILATDVVSDTNSQLLRQALREVVSRQYATICNDPELKLAGKSGTAEIARNEAGVMRLNSSFVGYDSESADLLLALTHFDSQDDEAWLILKKFQAFFQAYRKRKPAGQ